MSARHEAKEVAGLKPAPAQKIARPSWKSLSARSPKSLSSDQVRSIVAEEIEKALARFLIPQVRSLRESDETAIQCRMDPLPDKDQAREWQVSQNALARNAFIDQCGGLLTSAEVASVLGSKAKNRGALAKQIKDAGKVLSMRMRGQDFYPAFQFDVENAMVYPEMARVIDALKADYDIGWQLASWFTGNNEWLDGQTPLQVWTHDRNAVAQAAQEERALFHG